MTKQTFDSRLLSGVGVLSAVVRAGNFMRAAQALGLTQPAVSRAVSRLEQRVGVRIFHRTSRAVTLTDEGRRFYEAVAPLLAGIEAAAFDARETTSAVTGLLRVNADRIFAQHVLTPALEPFLAAHPELDVEIVVQERLGDLVADGFDLAFRFGDAQASPLICRRLMDVAVVTCASPAYLERRGAPGEPRDLETGHDCVLMRNPATGRPFDWEFVRAGETVPISVTGRVTVNDAGSLMGACLGGLCVGQPLEIYAQPHLAEGRLVRLLPDWADETFPVHVYHHEPKFAPEWARAFLRYVEALPIVAGGAPPVERLRP
ncbi:LysR family transcriptional regulator [Chenggangzhangella methanolivorans]|uniref:LysR family transcriptional regulator n=1 Tax=Chenggangzhangella methanolivorans TaxID=1437009 RepID=A0A9E6UNM7_9HYPH|nr:LysR family transcriptional regulator [Chenggangzhangella methanolivorans]QZO01291.1 LysR family transcriptional regulator [Chenggangzhangella methanolivorans]